MGLATISTSDIFISDTNQIKHVFAGAEISAGSVVYRSGGIDGLYYHADSDALGTAPLDLDGSEYGFTLNEAPGPGAPLAIARSGATIAMGAGNVFNGFTYYAGNNTGALEDVQPPSGEYGIAVGVALDSATLALRFHATGVATP